MTISMGPRSSSPPAMLNALAVTGKKIAEVKLVSSGAGAAALACLDLLVALGMPVANITVTDIAGAWSMRAAPS